MDKHQAGWDVFVVTSLAKSERQSFEGIQKWSETSVHAEYFQSWALSHHKKTLEGNKTKQDQLLTYNFSFLLLRKRRKNVPKENLNMIVLKSKQDLLWHFSVMWLTFTSFPINKSIFRAERIFVYPQSTTTFKYLNFLWLFHPVCLGNIQVGKTSLLFLSLFVWTGLVTFSSLSVLSAEMQPCPSCLNHFSRSGAKLKGWKRAAKKVTWQQQETTNRTLWDAGFLFLGKTEKYRPSIRSPPSCGFHFCASIHPLQPSLLTQTHTQTYTRNLLHIHIHKLAVTPCTKMRLRHFDWTWAFY